ncbi:MAG: hypothetical protein JWQ53_654, partial [Klenkia sp.]|nr:hypothetical protein [Klenkia sp.]
AHRRRPHAPGAAVTPDPAPPATPGRYRLTVPEGWWAINLGPTRAEANVAALVDHQWRGVDDAPHLKAEARAALLRQAQDAADAGGLQLFLSVGTLGGIPLSASLLVSAVPLAAPDELTDLAQHGRASGRDVTQVDLPAGAAVRTFWRQPPGDDDPSGLVTTCLDLHLAVPRAPQVLVLQFRTPMEPLAEVLVEVFDAIAGTLRWVQERPVDSEPGQDRDGYDSAAPTTRGWG